MGTYIKKYIRPGSNDWPSLMIEAGAGAGVDM
jgi:hypothetical protein